VWGNENHDTTLSLAEHRVAKLIQAGQDEWPVSVASGLSHCRTDPVAVKGVATRFYVINSDDKKPPPEEV